MTNEAERIGGISIDATISDAVVDAQLNALLAKMQAAAKQMSAALTITPAVAASAQGGSQRQQTQARVQAQRQARRQEQDEEQQGRIGFQTRMAAYELREGQQQQTRVQQVRRTAAQRAYSDSERQRKAELTATSRQYDSLAALATNYFDDQEKRAGRLEGVSAKGGDARRLRELSYLNQQANAEEPSQRGFAGRKRTPEEREQFVRDEQRRASSLTGQSDSAIARDERVRARVRATQAPRGAAAPGAPTPPDAVERERQRALASLEGRPSGARATGTSITAVRQSDEDIARREQLRITQQETTRLTAARTPRTFASGLGGFLPGLGNARAQIEINAGIAASEEKVRIARSRLGDPSIIRSPNAYRKATEELTVALKEQAGWQTKLNNLNTGGTALRSLAAVTIAGAAFGVAMQGVSVAIGLVEQGIGPTAERLSGFAATTAVYTSNLSDAARAANGNVQAVTALKLASTGLSASTAATIQPLIEQRVSIEAGNKAIQDQIEALHVAQNLQKQGANAGIGTTTGGFLGTPLFGIPSTGEQIGNLLQQLGGPAQAPATNRSSTGAGKGQGGSPYGSTFLNPNQGSAAAQAAFAQGLQYINDQFVKGGDSAATLTKSLDKLDPRIATTAAAFDSISPALAAAIRQNNLYSDSIKTTADAQKALLAFNFAGTLPDPALLAQQFNRARPAAIAALGRQNQYALNNQLPAQAGLAALAQPLTPVGTGIPGGATAAGQAKAIELQKQLNDYYAQGQQILIDTYKPSIVANFGQAAGNAFQSEITQIGTLGKEVAGLQADIANVQVGQQTKEYNYQLFIARRTLSDIGGLVGKNFGAGESFLGSLEKQNLALSRQGQLLQFNLSQRQINFQVALAGFQAPGVTPEERQANVAEAKLEASYAQKQLDIQKQMFGNTVKIVDIGNLRQGVDLARQIGLLISGRQANIKIAVDQQELVRAQARSEQLVKQAGVYLGSIDTLAGQAIGEIQQLEVAAGKALGSVAQQVLTAYGVVINGITAQLNGVGTTQGNFSGATGFAGGHGAHASGAIYQTTGPTMVSPGNMAGEAGSETVVILRHIRPYSDGGGGGMTNIFNITGNTVRNDDDLNTLVRKVTTEMGRSAALKGLRSAS